MWLGCEQSGKPQPAVFKHPPRVSSIKWSEVRCSLSLTYNHYTELVLAAENRR